MLLPFARTVIEREVVDSTSDLAKRLLVEDDLVTPLLVLAARQTAGRGRGDRLWWSDAGSLTFTLGLDPLQHGLRPEHEPRLALATAVAVVEALEAWVSGGIRLGIRWPNDIEAAGKKLGGILPERVETPRGPRLTIGLGLNVRTQLDRAPVEVRRGATSVEALVNASIEPRDVLVAILGHFERAVTALGRDDRALAERWDQLDTLGGHPVRVDLGPRTIVGVGRGIDRTGGLRLESGGRIVIVHGGRVLRD